MMKFFLITAFLSQAAAKICDFGCHPCSGCENMKIVIQLVGFSFLASINTISNGRNTPGECDVHRVVDSHFSTPLASFWNLTHLREDLKSWKITELWNIVVSQPLIGIEQTLQHQIDQSLVFLFQSVRTSKKTTKFWEKVNFSTLGALMSVQKEVSERWASNHSTELLSHDL